MELYIVQKSILPKIEPERMLPYWHFPCVITLLQHGTVLSTIYGLLIGGSYRDSWKTLISTFGVRHQTQCLIPHL